jgi:hypothetical protein
MISKYNDGRKTVEAGASQARSISTADDLSIGAKLDVEPCEDFPDVRSGDLVVSGLQVCTIQSTRSLGKYRVEQKGLGDRGHVFILTLFGATCSKARIILWWRELTKDDVVQAMKRAIEREIGYYQNRGAALPIGAERKIEITIRDTDFPFLTQTGT